MIHLTMSRLKSLTVRKYYSFFSCDFNENVVLLQSQW